MRRTRFTHLATVAALATASLTLALAGSAPASAAQSDEAIANAGLITRADLPPGYTVSTDDDSGPDLDDAAKKIPACRAFVALTKTITKNTKDKPTEAEGQDFETLTDSFVGSETSVFATADAAIKGLTALKSPTMTRCFEPLMKTAVEASLAEVIEELPKKQRKAASQVDVTVTSESGPGEDGIKYHVVIEAGILGGTPLYMDLVFLRTGRATGFYSFGNLGAPPTATAATVLPPVMARMTAAQA